MEDAERQDGKSDRQHGFTLLEILTVCVLIGMIAAFALPSYMQARRVVYEDNAISRLRRISLAENRYYAEYGRFGNFRELVTASYLPKGYSTMFEYRSPVTESSVLPFVDRYSLAFLVPDSPNSLYYQVNAIPMGENHMGLRTFNINLFITGQLNPDNLFQVPPVREGTDSGGPIIGEYPTRSGNQ
jgi:prepilin-type N-terminal cleavage/methylation domain-containing protein